MRSFKIYDFTLSAGGAMPLLVEGGYFKIYSCTGVLAVSIDGGSTIGPINTGQGMKTEFKRLTIVDQSGAANVGKIIVASNEFVDGRISGEVSVIDQAYKNTLANKTFASSNSSAAVAGQFSHCQLFNNNPAVNTILKSISLSVTVASGVAYGFRASTIATPGAFLTSKRSNGAASTSSRSYSEANVSDLITNQLGYRVLDVLNTAYVEFRDPVIVSNGWGFIARPSNANTGITVVCEVVEEPI